MFEFDPIALFDKFRERWYQKTTIAIALPILGLFIVLVLTQVNIDKISRIGWIILAASIVALWAFWYYSTRLPKTKTGHVGFIFSFETDQEPRCKQLRDDLVTKWKALLALGRFRYPFSIHNLAPYFAARVKDRKTADHVLVKTNSHFIVMGTVRLRIKNQKQIILLRLETLVRHAVIPEPVSQMLSMEFKQLFPTSLEIAIDADYTEAENRGQYYALASKYIIGTAALISGDAKYAANLFQDIVVQPGKGTYDTRCKVLARERLGDILLKDASLLYDKWINEPEDSTVSQIAVILQRCTALGISTRYATCLLSAITAFLQARDIPQAKRWLDKARRIAKNDAIWRYSYAFLFAYEGDLRRATSYYQSAFDHPSESHVELQTELFMLNVLKKEPTNSNIYYALGFLNYFGKQDLVLAKEYFQAFLSQPTDPACLEQRKSAETYLTKCG